MTPVSITSLRAFSTVIFLTAAQASIESSGESLFAQQPQSSSITTSTQPAISQSVTPSVETNAGPNRPSELTILEMKVRPAVIWVTAFDPKGNLLRTESGFFISADGRFVTTAHAVEGAVNAVAKTYDGGIYNVSGIVAASNDSDLALLQADVKPRKLLRFLDLNKTGELPTGGTVGLVGCALAGTEGMARQTTIVAEADDRLEIAAAIPSSFMGSPVVNENGEVVGVVTSAGEKTFARPVSVLDSLLSRLTTDTQPRWPEIAEARPTPHATPRPRLIYAPAPSFPAGQSLPVESETGRFRLTFGAEGNVTEVEIVKSTGNPYFDQAAVKTLRQWKSVPSRGWQAVVPVTFRTR